MALETFFDSMLAGSNFNEPGLLLKARDQDGVWTNSLVCGIERVEVFARHGREQPDRHDSRLGLVSPTAAAALSVGRPQRSSAEAPANTPPPQGSTPAPHPGSPELQRYPTLTLAGQLRQKNHRPACRAAVSTQVEKLSYP